MSGDSGVLVVTRVRSTTTKCTRGRGCNGHPAFPTPSLGERFINASGALRREGEAVSGIKGTSLRANGSAEWPPDDRLREAIHAFFARQDGLLRFARNDGAARWIACAPGKA